MTVQNQIENLLSAPVFEGDQEAKEQALLSVLNNLTNHHSNECREYNRLREAFGNMAQDAITLKDLPFVPVGLFKSHLLASVPEEERFKVLTSSGTTGQEVSRIVLDRITSSFQTKAVVKIMQNFIGKQRLPMLVIDHPGVVKNRESFSARGAGILGMSNFGRAHTYALRDEDMSLDIDRVQHFLEKHGEQPILLFGFTFMVWKFLVQKLETSGQKLSIPHGILVHSGGWKKLADEAVDNPTFKERLQAVTGIQKVHNFYGMVEQVGSIFVECERGHLHAPLFSDVIVRDPFDWSEAPTGKEGVVQVLSCLPYSYPGHSLLTEDRGTVLGVDDCGCGRKGKYFTISGRLPRAEARGCSDTFQAKGR
ncbi:acyl-protein synthetase [Pseudovibrio sp. JE062]|uniref:LuxE/PaaK family acyltransferase n=1 Tax=Pseudovibrio sp. JE062 TaxID=439495 RepID=UPI0018DDAA29|nr:acyl-protein synthetase [Pseudovibrio sp. JE062]